MSAFVTLAAAVAVATAGQGQHSQVAPQAGGPTTTASVVPSLATHVVETQVVEAATVEGATVAVHRTRRLVRVTPVTTVAAARGTGSAPTSSKAATARAAAKARATKAKVAKAAQAKAAKAKVAKAAKAAKAKAATAKNVGAASYGFLASDATGRPAHWDRCSIVRYRVNPAGAPSGALAEVRTALDKLAGGSGLRFSYAGPTSVVPYSTAEWSSAVPAAQEAELYIAWSVETTVSYLRGSVAGVGGPAYQTDSSGREPKIVRSGVTLDRATKVARGFGDGPRSGTLLLHELGHAVNLAHVEHEEQVMNPTVNARSQGAYQPGDLAGMRKLAAYDCF